MTEHRNRQPESLAKLGYLLFFLGIVFGITALMGAIISHTKLHQTKGTIARSHLLLQLIAFWLIVALIVLMALFANTGLVVWLAGLSGLLWLVTLVFGTLTLRRKSAVSFLNNQSY